MIQRKHLPWLIIGAVLLVDQTSKFLVKTRMAMGESIAVFGDWFYLHFTENYGMAFGLEFAGEYGKLLLSLFRIAAVIFIGFYLSRLIKKNAPKGLIALISLVMAGAIGNIIDSAFYGLVFSESYFNRVAQFLPEGGGYGTFLHGRVVDMFYAPIIQTSWPEWFPYFGGREFVFFRPVFNVADSAITLGVFFLLIFQKKYFAHSAPVAAPAEDLPAVPAQDPEPQYEDTPESGTS